MAKIILIGSGAMAKFFTYKLAQQHAIFVLGNHMPKSFNYLDQNEKNSCNQYHVNTFCEEADLMIWLTSTVQNSHYFKKYFEEFIDFKSPVLNLQNGMGYEGQFHKAFPNASVSFGSNEQAVLKCGDDIINTGSGNIFVANEMYLILKQLQITKNLNFVERPNIQLMRLQKLSVNCVINPITAYLNIQNGALLQHPEAIDLCNKIIRESLPFWHKNKVYSNEAAYFEKVSSICKNTANNNSSMLSAKLHNIPLEIEAILWPVIQETKSETLIFLCQKLTKTQS